VGEHVELRPGGSIKKLAGGANPELSTQLFGYNSEGRLTQRAGKQQGGLRTRCPTRLREDNERAGHERDFALFAAGLTSDEATPFFFYHEEHEGHGGGRRLSGLPAKNRTAKRRKFFSEDHSQPRPADRAGEMV